MSATGFRKSDLLLVGATLLGTLAIQHQLSRQLTSAALDERGFAPESEIKHPQPAARSPLDIKALGWKEIAFRTYDQISEDRLLAISAGVVFYGLLAIFPAITALVSSYGMFADASTITANLQTLSIMLPEGAFTVVRDQVARVLSRGSPSLSLTFGFGLLVAIWSANAGMKAIFDALNVVYGEREKRSWLVLNLVSLIFTLLGLVGVLVMVAAVVVAPLLLQRLGIEWQGVRLTALMRWPLIAIALLFGLAALYRFGPSRDAPRWQWLSVGAVSAMVLWIAASALLSWYLSNFDDYNATYGSLGAAIGLMMWMWISVIIILAGAELNSEIERQHHPTMK